MEQGIPAISAVETYSLRTTTGRHIRKATRVRFADGVVVSFIERMSKRDAIRQAPLHYRRHAPTC